jgi:hypothetical protein
MGEGIPQHRPPEPRDIENKKLMQLYVVNICAAAPPRTDDRDFDGSDVDTAAQTSVIGIV